MDTKDIFASRTTALAHIGPDRRRFLGMLLAGAAAAPLLTSAALAQAAGDKSDTQKQDALDKTSVKPPAGIRGKTGPTEPTVFKTSASVPTTAKTSPSVPTAAKSASDPAAHKSPDKRK
jgi:hypothetical protein